MMKNFDETEILSQINKGDEAGLKSLFDIYYKPLCIFSLNFIDSFDEAEDIVQDLFIKFWERKDKETFKGSLRAYLFSSIQHNCIKIAQIHNKYQFSEIEDYVDPVNSPMTEEEIEIQRQKIYTEIQRLPEQCRYVFEAIVLKDMKYKEVAQELNLSVNTIKTHLSRALKQLRSSLNIIVLLTLS
ncbi:MAG: RNA polymerase sigma-70 factor [Odoribacter sp.]